MFLKSIKANGFKSFAEKTELEFRPGITGIVGPNGSGKSNIVDAIKWVLGEQSAKSLRASGSLSDVIFAGTKKRDAQNRAMVALTFDNTDHYLNSEFNEIEIKRVMYRTGENEYYLNGVKVRLKDITDIFIDSGANKESFNIISQGSITDVINSKSEERRTMFESAAGVLKYKKRKEESLRKLDKTKENLERIDLLLNELEITISPLKEQAEVATKYLDYKKDLESVEIALIVKDITTLNEKFHSAKENISKLTEEITNMSMITDEDTLIIEKEKVNIINLENKINDLNVNLLSLTNEVAELNSQKQIIVERQKINIDDAVLKNNMVMLKEEELTLKNNITSLDAEIEILKQTIEKKTNLRTEKNNEIKKLIAEKNSYNESIAKDNKIILECQNKINILETAIENNSALPYAVKSILNNPKFTGIHNVIGNLLTIDESLVLAIDTALGYSANVIVVDSELIAKNCITYLKENNLGRATFFPINIIKGKYIESDVVERVKQIDGFIGIASDLVTYDSQYENIVRNQLGNVLVVKNIDSLNMLGRIIQYRYKIVSLTGEILHTGGSVTGGSNRNSNNINNQKIELDKLNSSLKNIETNLKTNEIKYAEILEELQLAESSEYEINRSVIDLNEQLNRKNISRQDLMNIITAKTQELKTTKSTIANKLDKDVDNILEKLYKKTSEKELLEKKIIALKEEKSELTEQIQILENSNKKRNSEYNKKQNELKNLEIEYSKLDIRLDSLLQSLSENYNMTYEKARTDYELTIPEDDARSKVNNLKIKIKALGDINTGSINEFERLNKRYNFLDEQKKDINLSIDNLLTIITEMDEIMKDKFANTFDLIKSEFAEIFKKLFKGGEGVLKLTEPDNLLETGIDIIAMPPGKKLNSITLLSGGEKTLTAIALLFAIINVQSVPFCVLDEVEAALDEVNVEMVGNYLKEKKDLSQFIIITHKKKTMEYADVLYGITMQESGVSKLVSVVLEKI